MIFDRTQQMMLMAMFHVNHYRAKPTRSSRHFLHHRASG